VAANRREKQHVVSGIMIGIRGTGDKFYIEKNDVQKQIEIVAGGSLMGRPVSKVQLAALENELKGSEWIRNAEIYFDTREILHVLVDEREPIARVFTRDGRSFYIDSSGYRMPLLEKVSARVPVVTGFTTAKKLYRNDSALLQGVKAVAGFIYSDPFWSAQIGQIDITPERNFELIPVIGDHVIKIGGPEKIAEKMERLFVFYKQVMSRTGFNRYAALDIRFDGQVVGVNRGPGDAVDSIRLKKNIEELMQRTSLQDIDQDMLPVTNTQSASDSAKAKTAPQAASLQAAAAHTANPDPAKTTTRSKPIENPKQQVRTNQRPKAVMRRRT
jgi:cell division protein FtsQ